MSILSEKMPVAHQKTWKDWGSRTLRQAKAYQMQNFLYPPCRHIKFKLSRVAQSVATLSYACRVWVTLPDVQTADDRGNVSCIVPF